MDKIYVKRFSAAFKQRVVREYEEGASLTELVIPMDATVVKA